MLEELLKFDNLGSKLEYEFILFEILPLKANRSLNDFQYDSFTKLYNIGNSLNAILKILEFLSFVEINNDTINCNERILSSVYKIGKDKYFQDSHFFQRLFENLNETDNLSNLFNTKNIRQDHHSKDYYVLNHLIPHRYINIKNLLINLCYFIEDDKVKNNLLINKVFYEHFNKRIISGLNKISLKKRGRKFTVDEIKNKIKENEELGKLAEEYVIKYERGTRLKEHPNKDLIQRISDEYNSAGYDIESFNDSHSISINRYIEVKSYQKDIIFFISNKELRKSKEIADEYFLYLVDRDKMNNESYKPLVFKNPYEIIFNTEFVDGVFKFGLQNENIEISKENFKVTLNNDFCYKYSKD